MKFKYFYINAVVTIYILSAHVFGKVLHNNAIRLFVLKKTELNAQRT